MRTLKPKPGIDAEASGAAEATDAAEASGAAGASGAAKASGMSKAKSRVFLVAFFLPWLYLYTFLHEGGHALVGLAYGAKIERFVLGFNAHVGLSGGAYTAFGLALFNAAGMLLPLLVGVIALLFYKEEVESALYHLGYAGVVISLAASVLPWVAIPVLSVFGTPPPGDDVTKFLQIVGIHPYGVVACAIGLIGAFILLAVKRGLSRRAWQTLLSMREAQT